MHFGAEGVAVVLPRHVEWGDGVVVPRAVGAGGEVYGEEGVAARGCPVGGDVVGVGVFKQVVAEGVGSFAQVHGEGRVVVVVYPDGCPEGVGLEGEAAVVLVGEDAHDAVFPGILVGVHLRGVEAFLEMGVGACGAVAEVPEDAVGRAFVPRPEGDGVVHAPDGVLAQAVGGDAVDGEVGLAGL